MGLEGQGNSPSELNIRYIKSSHDRVIYVDGAWGGTTPQLNIHMALYSEHPSIPESINLTFTSGGEIINMSTGAGSIQGKTIDNVVREIEVEAIMTPDVARSLFNWLHDKLEEIEKLQHQSDQSIPTESVDADGES